MLHVTPTSAVACPPTHGPESHPDAELLALAPELQAAATPYLAYGRDNDVTRADSDFDEAMETARTLWENVRDIAERVLMHEPRTLAGLSVVAQAAALLAEERWKEAAEFVGPEGRLLRLVCNPLFQLAGIDWRGQPDAEAPFPAQPALTAPVTMDADLLALGRTFDAAFAAYLPERPGEMIATELRQAAWDAEPDLTPEAVASDPQVEERWKEIGRQFEGPIVMVNRLREAADDPAEAAFRLPPPRTVAGLAVLARMLAGFHAELWDEPSEDLDIDQRMLRATLEATLAIAGVDRLGRPVADAGGGSQILTAPAPAHDVPLIRLAESAIAEERAANAVVEASEHDTPRGTFDHALQLLERVTALDARTPAGLAAKARLLLAHIPDGEEFEGDFRCEALALSIARDAARLGAGDVTAMALEPPQPMLIAAE